MSQEAILFLSAIGVLLALILWGLALRYIFRIKRQLWNQKQQINILISIAEKLGVRAEEFEQVKSMNGNDSDAFL